MIHPVVETPPVVPSIPDVTIAPGAKLAKVVAFTDLDAGDSWTGRVDYGDGRGPQPLSIGAGPTILLAHAAYPAPGNYATKVTITDHAGLSVTRSFVVHVVVPSVPGGTTTGGGVAATPPTVLALRRVGIHWQPTRLVVTFSQPMDGASVANASNYVIVSPGRDGRFGTRDDQRIAVRAATYDPATSTVVLTPAHRLNWHWLYQVTVNGQTGSPVRGTNGLSLDGTQSGSAGHNYVAQIRYFGVVTPRASTLGLLRASSTRR